MKNCEREDYKKHLIEDVYKHSWTYAKMTDKERHKIVDALYSANLYGNTTKQLAEELHYIYMAFLSALDYTPIGWRETQNTPRF